MAKKPEEKDFSGIRFKRYKVVLVQYYELNTIKGKSYSFFTDIPDLAEGELVVVDSEAGPVIAQIKRVVGLTSAEKDKATKLVVCRLDLSELSAKYAEMHELIEIRQNLQERKAEMEELAVLKLLAQSDPEAAALMKRFHQLTGDPCYNLGTEGDENGN